MRMVSLEHSGFVDAGTCKLQNLTTGVFLESDGDGAATHTAHSGVARRFLRDSEIHVLRMSEWDGQSRWSQDVDMNMSVPRSVGKLDRNGSEFREMWQMEMRAHPAGRVLRLVHMCSAYCSITKRRCRSLVLTCVVVLFRLSRYVLWYYISVRDIFLHICLQFLLIRSSV